MTDMATGGRLVVRGGRVLDPATGVDGDHDVVLEGDRIAAVVPRGQADQGPAGEVIDATGLVVCPGLVDLHVHVFEWATDFGVPPEAAGVDAGVTTGVDMGSAGAWSLPGFRHHVVERATTELFSFINITLIGSMQAGRGGPGVFNPDFVDPEAIERMHAAHPDLVKGIKTYAESGGWSKGWQPFLTKALDAAGRTGLPLYIHTGELLGVDEAHRPDPDSIMPEVLAAARPGDILGHCYSGMPDGILGRHRQPPPELYDAVERGVRLDVGHGLNFCFDTARRMMDGGLLPWTISSDAHGELRGVHEIQSCTWSLVGTISKLVALGMSLGDCVLRATQRPAALLGMDHEIGTLAVGSRADLTLLREVPGEWTFTDGCGGSLTTDRRHLPELVVRAGVPHRPSQALMRDVAPERFLAGLEVAAAR
jgi:dihydroorotase